MPKVNWSPENDRKLLIHLITRSAKAYDTAWLSTLFPGATPKAIEERIAKLKREAKSSAGNRGPRNDDAEPESNPRKRARPRCDDPDATEDEREVQKTRRKVQGGLEGGLGLIAGNAGAGIGKGDGVMKVDVDVGGATALAGEELGGVPGLCGVGGVTKLDAGETT